MLALKVTVHELQGGLLEAMLVSLRACDRHEEDEASFAGLPPLPLSLLEECEQARGPERNEQRQA